MPAESIINYPQENENDARATGWEDLTEVKPVLGANNIRTENYENSEFGQQELSAEAEYDALEAQLDQAVADGKITQDHANRLLEKKLEEVSDTIAGVRQDFVDRQSVGTEEEQQRYEDHWNDLETLTEEPHVDEAVVAETTSEEAIQQEAPVDRWQNLPRHMSMREARAAGFTVDQYVNNAAPTPVEETATEQEPVAEAEPEIELSDELKQRLNDDYLNIEDMLKSGRIDEEKAARFRKEVEDKYRNEALAAKAAEEAAEEVAEPETGATEAVNEEVVAEEQVAEAEPEAEPEVAETEPVAEPEPVAETPKEAIARQKEMLENIIIPTGSVEEVKKEAGMTPEEKRREDMMDYLHIVESNFSQINGQLGEDILLDDGSKDISDIQRDMWWDSLDNEARKVVAGIYLQREEMSNRWLEGSEKHLFPRGQKFANWIAKKIVRLDKAA